MPTRKNQGDALTAFRSEISEPTAKSVEKLALPGLASRRCSPRASFQPPAVSSSVPAPVARQATSWRWLESPSSVTTARSCNPAASSSRRRSAAMMAASPGPSLANSGAFRRLLVNAWVTEIDASKSSFRDLLTQPAVGKETHRAAASLRDIVAEDPTPLRKLTPEAAEAPRRRRWAMAAAPPPGFARPAFRRQRRVRLDAARGWATSDAIAEVPERRRPDCGPDCSEMLQFVARGWQVLQVSGWRKAARDRQAEKREPGLGAALLSSNRAAAGPGPSRCVDRTRLFYCQAVYKLEHGAACFNKAVDADLDLVGSLGRMRRGRAPGRQGRTRPRICCGTRAALANPHRTSESAQPLAQTPRDRLALPQPRLLCLERLGPDERGLANTALDLFSLALDDMRLAEGAPPKLAAPPLLRSLRWSCEPPCPNCLICRCLSLAGRYEEDLCYIGFSIAKLSTRDAPDAYEQLELASSYFCLAVERVTHSELAGSVWATFMAAAEHLSMEDTAKTLCGRRWRGRQQMSTLSAVYWPMCHTTCRLWCRQD
uniref:Separase n=1 Tax=Macrostomum lignano TaxID=282301 RepID=A0A1I8FFH3_9PLAT